MSILQVDNSSEKEELEFELNYLKKLSIGERMQMMLQKSKEMAKILRRNEEVSILCRRDSGRSDKV